MKLLALALCALSSAAAEAQTEEALPADVAIELRRELSSLRARLLKLEAMLETHGESGAFPDRESFAEAAAPAAPNPRNDSPPQVVHDAEPAGDIPVGPVSSGGQTIAFTGLLDTYLTYNANRPADGQNTLYFTNPNSRGFGLNQAKLEFDASGGGPVGFRSDIWFGSAGRLYWGGLTGPGPLEDVVYFSRHSAITDSTAGPASRRGCSKRLSASKSWSRTAIGTTPWDCSRDGTKPARISARRSARRCRTR